jgi:hypothetical protein
MATSHVVLDQSVVDRYLSDVRSIREARESKIMGAAEAEARIEQLDDMLFGQLEIQAAQAGFEPVEGEWPEVELPNFLSR